MFLVLVAVVVVSIAISALCSLMEAALFAVPLPHVKHLADEGSRRGKMLLEFKQEMGQPIAAILILNTVSHTIGAAVAGAVVAQLYGEEAVIAFSVVFTLMILYLSEIIPKQIGASFSKRTALLIATPLRLLIKMLWPLVVVTESVSKRIGGDAHMPSVSPQEVLSMTDIGREEGVIDHFEGSVIKNIVGLDKMLVKDVLTPRVVVFRLKENTTVEEVRESIMEWNHTRVPLFKEDEPDYITHYVIQRDILRALLKGEKDISLHDLARPLTTVTEFMRTDKLLLQMFEMRESMCSVVDEHGGFAGLVTIEDIMEEIVGTEIVDEYDRVSDLRSYAQDLYQQRSTTDEE